MNEGQDREWIQRARGIQLILPLEKEFGMILAVMPRDSRCPSMGYTSLSSPVSKLFHRTDRRLYGDSGILPEPALEHAEVFHDPHDSDKGVRADMKLE
jgi:hypothetical protein